MDAEPLIPDPALTPGVCSPWSRECDGVKETKKYPYMNKLKDSLVKIGIKQCPNKLMIVEIQRFCAEDG